MVIVFLYQQRGDEIEGARNVPKTLLKLPPPHPISRVLVTRLVLLH